MPFTVPVFNLNINIWHAGFGPPGPPSVAVLGNLQWGRKRGVVVGWGGTTGPQHTMWLLLPALTDIRGDFENAPLQGDLVEAPAGSGKYYVTRYVDDVAKGFANEYRCAIIQQQQAFPVPIP
jgi:hypothetical protein